MAELVSSESEEKYPNEDPRDTWKRRKEDSIRLLRNSTDTGVKMLWLADKLSNIRSLAGIYSERGGEMWKSLNQSDPAMHRWYYKSIAETLELSLNKTGAFKELIKHINFIWPGTFDSEKAKYKKYREVSADGCKRIGQGAKGDVYRYDDELVIKVCNQNDALPTARTLVHGDFHTNNVFLQRGEPLLIDMDRMAVGHPIAEVSDLYYFYVVLGEDDPSVSENFMGFSYETAKRFYDSFLRCYLGTDDEEKLREVTEKASLMCGTRMIRKLRRKGELTDSDREKIDGWLKRTAAVVNKYDTLTF